MSILVRYPYFARTVFGEGKGFLVRCPYFRGSTVLHTPSLSSSPALPDLLEGNVKGVMKVILALAERYQPKSVKPRTVETSRPPNYTAPLPDSQYGIRQELVRPYTHPQTPSRPDQTQSSFHSSGLYPSPYPVDPATEGMYSSPIDTLPANKPPQVLYVGVVL